MDQGPKHIIGFIGWSGTGKTTLLSNLVPNLIGRGLSVSTMKHTHHDFDMDQPSKDSYRHREAGAREVLVTSQKRWALLHELRNEPESEMESLIAKMAPVDILLIEGFKAHDYPKIEVHRPSRRKDLLCLTDDSVVALATDDMADARTKGVKLPLIDLNDVKAMAEYIVSYLGLTR